VHELISKEKLPQTLGGGLTEAALQKDLEAWCARARA
jgi:hypothetical protein